MEGSQLELNLVEFNFWTIQLILLRSWTELAKVIQEMGWDNNNTKDDNSYYQNYNNNNHQNFIDFNPFE